MNGNPLQPPPPPPESLFIAPRNHDLIARSRARAQQPRVIYITVYSAALNLRAKRERAASLKPFKTNIAYIRESDRYIC